MFVQNVQMYKCIKFRLKESLCAAKIDIDFALELRADDNGAKRLLIGIELCFAQKAINKRVKVLVNDDAKVDEIMHVFIEFLEININDELLNLENVEICNLLLNNLLVSVDTCVPFVEENGIYLCLKYLKIVFCGEFVEEKMEITDKIFSLLNFCCEKVLFLFIFLYFFNDIFH